MSYIQLLYGFVKNNTQIQFNLPNNHEENQYIKRLPYITNNGPAVENQILNVLKNREDLKNGYQQQAIMEKKYKRILMR